MDALKAEKIVNEFGRTMIIVNQLNRIRMENLINDVEGDREPSSKYGTDPYAKHKLLRNMVSLETNRSPLPYPPGTIKEALELLLEYEKDDYNIETLKLGLRYLDYFK